MPRSRPAHHQIRRSLLRRLVFLFAILFQCSTQLDAKPPAAAPTQPQLAPNFREDLLLKGSRISSYDPYVGYRGSASAGGLSSAPPGLFPDHDCRRVQHPIVDWHKLRTLFRTQCEPSKYTSTLQCSTQITNWADGLAFLEDFTDFPVKKGKTHDSMRKRAQQQCPLGYLTLMIVRLMQCILKEAMGDCYLPYSVHVREIIRTTDYKVFLGSDWPVFALLNTIPWDWPGYDREHLNFDCVPEIVDVEVEDVHDTGGAVGGNKCSAVSSSSSSEGESCKTKSKKVVKRAKPTVADWAAFRDLFTWPEDHLPGSRNHFEKSIYSYHGDPDMGLNAYAIDAKTPEAKKAQLRMRMQLFIDANPRFPRPLNFSTSATGTPGAGGADVIFPAIISGRPQGQGEGGDPDEDDVSVREKHEDDVSVHSFVRENDPETGKEIYRAMQPSKILLPPETSVVGESRTGTAGLHADSNGTPEDLNAFSSARAAHFYSNYRSWWLDSIKFVYDSKISNDTATASTQCLYGLYTANVIKALWAADTESSAFGAYVEHIHSMFFESLHFLGGTAWPLFALLDHGKSLRRHKFNLDFSEEELGMGGPPSTPSSEVLGATALPWRFSGGWLQSLDNEEHLRKLLPAFSLKAEEVVGVGSSASSVAVQWYKEQKEKFAERREKTTLGKENEGVHQLIVQKQQAQGTDRPATAAGLNSFFSWRQGHFGWRVSYRELMRQIMGTVLSVAGNKMNKLLYVSFVYGRYKKYLRGWGKRLRALHLPNFLFFCLDWETLVACERELESIWGRAGARPRCAIGESISSLNKFTIVLLALQLGFDVFWLDLDIYLVQNPTKTLYETVALGDEDRGKPLKAFDFGKKYEDWASRSDIGLYPLQGDAYSEIMAQAGKNSSSSSATKEVPSGRGSTAQGEGDSSVDDETRSDISQTTSSDNDYEPPRGYEMLISYSFFSDCICNGFFFMRATPTMIRWLEELLLWLYHHPYEHDQRAMSAFLNYTERVALPEPGERTQHKWAAPPVPHWFVFEPYNRFINWPTSRKTSLKMLTLKKMREDKAETVKREVEMQMLMGRLLRAAC
eukprot:g8364.t1